MRPCEYRTLKLEYYGVWVTNLKTRGSYLRNQVKIVLINEARSKPKRIVHGVPKGSVLGVHVFLGNDI